MSALGSFLLRNSVNSGNPGGTLPLVHSLSGYRFGKLLAAGQIVAEECDVFKEENLNYFFMGRPAYKVKDASLQAETWELPCCFIFEYAAIGNIKRVFPFDSGGHYLELYPHYINMMPLDEFEVSDVEDAPSRIVGAFFGTPDAYFHLRPKDEAAFEREFSLGPKDAEVRAAHKLARHPAPQGFDDRRFTIELQTSETIDLKVVKPLAVIMPAVYLDDEETRRIVVQEWKAEPISYPINSLSVNQYYGQIYERVERFYKDNGYL